MSCRRSFLGLVCAFFVLAGCVNDALAQQPGKDEQLLIQIEHDWCAANIKKDASTFARIMADDYTSVGSRGGKSTKAEEIAGLKTGEPVTACTNTDMRVRIYGDTAVVTGLGTSSGTFKGVPYKDRHILWTDTFIRKDGRWQCVATHGTLVAAEQK